MELQLKRYYTDNDAVYGDCKVISHLGNLKAAFHTLENKRYLIAPGYYPLRLTWSPRFNRYMPEVCDVPHRSGYASTKALNPSTHPDSYAISI